MKVRWKFKQIKPEEITEQGRRKAATVEASVCYITKEWDSLMKALRKIHTF
jgi:hypothetical protein